MHGKWSEQKLGLESPSGISSRLNAGISNNDKRGVTEIATSNVSIDALKFLTRIKKLSTQPRIVTSKKKNNHFRMKLQVQSVNYDHIDYKHFSNVL